jgi:Zn-finger nucleic acid-binding protein
MLITTERHEVEIIYCRKCKGIWLNKGELDKIIEKAMRDQQNFENYHHHNDGYYNSNYQRKRKSIFPSSLFKFD